MGRIMLNLLRFSFILLSFVMVACTRDTTRLDRGIVAVRPGLPDATLWFDAAPKLRAIELVTPDPENAAAPGLREEMLLSGEITGAGIRWPRAFVLRFDDKPYFDLELETFTPRTAE